MKLTLSLLCLVTATLASAKNDWNRFRGPNGTGISDTKGLPTVVDETTTVWKVAMEKGWSSPVLWENMIVLTAETGPSARAVIALDAKTGKELWRHQEKFTEHRQNRQNSFASSSPFVDADRIYINWSTGTVIQALALDHQGKLLWRNEHVADYIHEHGTAASALVVDGIMIVRSEFDTKKGDKVYTDDPAQLAWKSCIAGLDAATGKEAWRLDIPNSLNTYSTPIVNVRKDGATEIICTNTANGVMGINPKTGKLNWQYNPGFKQRSLSSGVLHNGIYFCTFGSGGGAKELAAVDVSGPEPKALGFEFSKGLPYVPTPLVIDDLMYLLGDGGILKVVEFKTGKEIYNERVNGSGGSSKFFSSPVAADGKIYAGSQQGDFIVLKTGPKFEQVAATKLDSPINASFAIGPGRLYVRTEKSLYCIGDKTAPVP